ncbi:aminoglycoside phosphotransferase family protein [Compostibacter hankyongensis]|uniref:Phosphotransferase n=1 Tax=Compostibacter hankyongensis TaxID=1007089 RepID=A0ABP8G9Y1_9BACT
MIVHPQILEAFDLKEADYDALRYGSGHINSTIHLKSKKRGKDYILQRINTHVFKRPDIIDRNQRLAAAYLKKQAPDYFFLSPVPTVAGPCLFEWQGEYWRLLPFVKHTVAVNQADNPRQAFEAAQQFGRLARLLSGIDLREFQPSIPNFHNLTLRYSSFQDAIRSASEERREAAEDLTEAFLNYSGIAVRFEELKTDKDFRDRLMHHDTKINNVLLDDKTYEGICVIDLDTLMPGKLISDLGDMVRTYVSPVSEEEQDFDKIVIRDDYYEALMQGYLSELKGDLTPTEKEVLFYAGQFIIYMQGIRFLTDYLNGDVYYPVKYPEHNYNRAKNQLTLLQRLNEREAALRRIIGGCL